MQNPLGPKGHILDVVSCSTEHPCKLRTFNIFYCSLTSELGSICSYLLGKYHVKIS